MSFSYQILTDDQIQESIKSSMLEPGDYNFQVIDAISKISKTNNPMIELKLTVWGNDGKEFLIFDYLVGTLKCAWKIKGFCDSVGLSKEYLDGIFNEKLCVGKCGKASIDFQAGTKKPNGGYYKDKNVVEHYICEEKSSLPKENPKKEDDLFNDDLPF